MTKHDLSLTVARLYPQYSVREVETMVNAVFASLTAALARGEGIELRGFGSFGVRHHPAREGRNLRTGAVVVVPTKQALFFKVAKELRGRVDGHEDPEAGRSAAKPLTEKAVGHEG